MAQLPADVSPGDGSHDDHHDALHGLYNHMDTVGGGDVTAAWTAAEKSKLAAIEAAADVTDTTNVTAAGALMDSEVDADIKTLSLPASTTISTFGASLVDDADAAAARATLGVTVPTVLDEDNMASNSATGVPSQQSVKAYVDSNTGSGTVRNTHAHSVVGALSVTRAAADQDTVVTVTANATSFTDSMSNRDIHHYTFINGTPEDYTADLSGITDWTLVPTPLTGALNVYETTVATLLLRKIEGVLYGTLDVAVPGSAQAPATGVRAAQVWNESNAAAHSIPGTPVTGERIIMWASCEGLTGEPSTAWQDPTNGNTVNTVVTYAAGDFEPPIRVWETIYDGATTSFTFGETNGAPQAHGMIIPSDPGSAVRASAGSQTANPESVASVAADSLVIAILNIHDNDVSATTAPSGYTMQANNTAESTFRQTAVATLVQTALGAADPGAFTLSGSAQESSITIVVDA